MTQKQDGNRNKDRVQILRDGFERAKVERNTKLTGAELRGKKGR